MFKKDYDGTKQGRIGNDLNNLLSEISHANIEELLDFSYPGLSNYFVKLKINSLNSLVQKGLFPPKANEYVIQNRSSYNLDMSDSYQLFYMEGVYKVRGNYNDNDYFGVDINGKITLVAYTNKNLLESGGKTYLNSSVLDKISRQTFKKILIVTGLKMAEYKTSDN